MKIIKVCDKCACEFTTKYKRTTYCPSCVTTMRRMWQSQDYRGSMYPNRNNTLVRGFESSRGRQW